jgi:UDP-hydrolysing UDP-N-acetyl-D-glucosamine 2-epimerase
MMKAIQDSPNLELQLIAGASALLYRFGKVISVIEQDGFSVNERIHYVVEGENLITQAKSTGLGIIELATAFSVLRPDIVITVADRYETMATAVASSYLNIPLGHVQGGEVSGNIDESVRHAVTKLAHIHFPSTEQSRQRIIRMGEEEWRVHNTGCPAMDILKNIDLSLPSNFFADRGTGMVPDISKPYILALYHPVTTSYGSGQEQIALLMSALKERPEQKIILWPNSDAGSDDVSKGLREFRENNRGANFGYFINFSPEDYARLLANASCLVGNSSSFVREAAHLGIPSIILGDRQIGREHGQNAIYCDLDAIKLREAIALQMKHGRYPSENIFGDGQAGKKIAGILGEIPLVIRKKITY